jgi:DNA-binding transcriptional MerR regulator
MAFTVGELSRLTGVTVRALHHYDEIGLVQPSQRTAAGYRLYDDADVIRLQQVLLFRELGLPLDEIAAAIEATESREELLRRHREVLITKRARIDAMVAALDAALALLEKGEAMTPEDFKTMFDGFDPSQYEDEVKERWGDSDAYKESARRTKGYGKAEWQQIKDEAQAITLRLAELMQAGVAPGAPEVQEVIARHREHISRWFYPCSVEIQKGLGEMYVADPRFTENIDRTAPGLARFWRDAIAAS